MVASGSRTGLVLAACFAAACVPAAASAAVPPPGNPDGREPVPAEARAVDTSRPTRTVGTGTPASCTSRAVVAAVARGGIITFDCGPDPVVIVLRATAKVRNTRRASSSTVAAR